MPLVPPVHTLGCSSCIHALSTYSQRWAISWGDRKTFRLTLSLFVLLCWKARSINNKSCCLRASPRGLISSMDPGTVTGMALWGLSPLLRGTGSLCVAPSVSRGAATTTHIHPRALDTRLRRAREQATVPLKTHANTQLFGAFTKGGVHPTW